MAELVGGDFRLPDGQTVTITSEPVSLAIKESQENECTPPPLPIEMISTIDALLSPKSGEKYSPPIFCIVCPWDLVHLIPKTWRRFAPDDYARHSIFLGPLDTSIAGEILDDRIFVDSKFKPIDILLDKIWDRAAEAFKKFPDGCDASLNFVRLGVCHSVSDLYIKLKSCELALDHLVSPSGVENNMVTREFEDKNEIGGYGDSIWTIYTSPPEFSSEEDEISASENEDFSEISDLQFRTTLERLRKVFHESPNFSALALQDKVKFPFYIELRPLVPFQDNYCEQWRLFIWGTRLIGACPMTGDRYGTSNISEILKTYVEKLTACLGRIKYVHANIPTAARLVADVILKLPEFSVW